MDMNIDADGRVSTGNAENEVGTFRPDAAQGEQCRLIAGQFAAELVTSPPGDVANLPGLGLVKSAGGDQVVNLFDGQPADVGRGAGAGEEPAGDGHGGLIAGADGDDAGEEQFEHR